MNDSVIDCSYNDFFPGKNYDDVIHEVWYKRKVLIDVGMVQGGLCSECYSLVLRSEQQEYP